MAIMGRRPKRYSCSNGCVLPPRRKQLHRAKDGKYSYQYNDLTFCPVCGSMMPETRKKVEGFFEVFTLHPALKKAKQLILKSEFESAAREAFVTVEVKLRKLSELDSHGKDLAVRSLKFEYDKTQDKVTTPPLIPINDLLTESQRNEQEGFRSICQGFFSGPRNIFQHNHVGSGVADSITVVIEASSILYALDGHSLTKNGHWIKSEGESYTDILAKMPKRSDRWRLKREALKSLERGGNHNK